LHIGAKTGKNRTSKILGKEDVNGEKKPSKKSHESVSLMRAFSEVMQGQYDIFDETYDGHNSM
jgi:hypothetical protein